MPVVAFTTSFGDAFFYPALWNRRDGCDERARQEAETFDGVIGTTRWGLMEVADGLADSAQRTRVRAWFERLESDPLMRVIGFDDALFQRGLALYDERPDKKWSLTDCISFVVMKDEGLTEALTGDGHFEQSGFVALLA